MVNADVLSGVKSELRAIECLINELLQRQAQLSSRLAALEPGIIPGVCRRPPSLDENE